MNDLNQRDKDIALDALAMVAAAERGDKASFEAMLSTYQGDEPGKAAEREKLLAAVFGHAVAVLRFASSTIGVPPDKILGGVRTELIR